MDGDAALTLGAAAIILLWTVIWAGPQFVGDVTTAYHAALPPEVPCDCDR